MNISAQFFDDILNDATLATTAQGQRIAQAHNDNSAAHSAYDVFRDRWQQRYDAHAARTKVLLSQSELEKALNDFQRNMPQDADGIAAGLKALTAKIDDNEQATKDHAAETGVLRKAFGALAMAEAKIENLANWTAADTRATLQNLNDSSLGGSIDRVRRGRNSSYARIKDDATRRLQHINDNAQTQQTAARNAFNTYLDKGFVTPKPIIAPGTARFRRKAEQQP